MARVIERYFGPRELADIRYDPKLQETARRLVDCDDALELNWALLDLAAMVCKPRNPECSTCPLSERCGHACSTFFHTVEANPMLEQERHIGTPDGRMDIFVTCPGEDGTYPVVVFYMDAVGIREELRDMARRIAAEGYFVVLPNLYYREVDATSAEYAEMPADRRIEYARHINNRRVMQDTDAILNYVETDPQADASAVGAVGFCMSGAFVLAAAGTYPDRIKCAASIYGVNLVTGSDDSPHLLADRVAGELYFACSEHDDWVPGNVIDQLEAHLDAAAVNYRLEWYPGTRHGFAFADRADAYDEVSAERLWQRLFSLFARNLRGQ